MPIKSSKNNCERKKVTPKIIAVIKARNERENISETILSLKRQTLPPKQIIVVNDGSTDGTGEVAKKLGCVVIDLPYHAESYVGKPELAKVLNVGLKVAAKENPDYILTVDADHLLPKNYVECLIKRMEENPKLVIASGRIKGEPYNVMHPRGSGRIIRTSFWRKVNNVQYPVCWGWESWLCLKAMQLGYEVRCFRDIETEVKRPTKRGKAGYGKAMYALGYDWKYALGRCALTFLESPKAGLIMFWEFIRHNNVKRLDIAEWVNQMQKKRFWKHIWRIIRRKTRI